jgi:hypothetical protein
MNGFEILMVADVAGYFLTATRIPHNRSNRRHLKGVKYARTQDSSFDHSVARGLGLGAIGSCADFSEHWRSTRLFVRLLRLCAVWLRTHGILRLGIFLQRHLRRHGPMGWLGL